MCQHLSDPNEVRRAKVIAICRESQKLLGFTGLNSFLLVQKEQLQKVKSSFDSRMSAADIEASKTTFVNFEVSVYMETAYTRIRYIH